jgi:PAS domain S-box-containing protein
MPLWLELFLSQENIIIPSVEDLPDTWKAERETLEAQGIQSVIAIPMLIDGNLMGFAGLDTVVKKRNYKTSEINILKVWSNLLSGLIAHRRKADFVEQTRKNYETFFNTIDDFLFVLDEGGNIIHTNNTVIKRLEYTAEELLSKSVLMVHPEERRKEAGRIVGEMLAGTADFCPVPLVTKSGNYIPVETRVKPGYWDGKPVIFGVTKDVSKIKLSEEKFAKAFQFNSALMAITGFDDGVFLDVNDAFIKTTGYSRKELIGKASRTINLIDDLELSKSMTEKFNHSIPVREVEVVARTKSGGQIIGLFSADPIFVGEQLCLLTMIVDISERKKAEKALRESEKRFSLFMDYLPAVVFLKDHVGKTLFVNKYMDDAFGASEWVGKTMSEVYPNELGERITRDDANSMQLGYQKIEESMLQLDGRMHFYETQKFVIQRSGEEPMLGGVSLDITERKQSEVELRESEEKHSSMISNISDVIGIMAVDGKMKYKSPNIEKHFGWKPEDLIGTDGWLTIHPDDLVRIQTEFYNLLQNDKGVKTVEYRYKCKDGSYKPIELTATNLINNAIIGGVLLNYHDITERKLAEEEILKTKNEAEKANYAKSEFLSRMSHELRTPMNSILGFAQLLEMGELNSSQKKGVSHIMNSGKHLLKLINEVLDISSIEAGRISFIPEPVQLSGLIAEVVDSMQYLAGLRQITMEFFTPEAGQLYVISDRQRLKQVLLNLINNAIKYNIIGGTVFIKAELMPESSSGFYVRISVTDTGMGIAKDDIHKLFLPFERIGAEKTETEGSGLGLAVVKKIMDVMSGCINVESEPGEGSTFWIEIPYSHNYLEATGKGADFQSGDSNTSKSMAGTILYIEDNESNVELVDQILTTQRSNIQLISDKYGRNAVKLALKHKPDLIFLDLDLPDMHGTDALTQLLSNKKTRDIPVVVISADAMPVQITRLMKAGASGYLTKPLDIASFLKVVDEWTGNRKV